VLHAAEQECSRILDAPACLALIMAAPGGML